MHIMVECFPVPGTWRAPFALTRTEPIINHALFVPWMTAWASRRQLKGAHKLGAPNSPAGILTFAMHYACNLFQFYTHAALYYIIEYAHPIIFVHARESHTIKNDAWCVIYIIYSILVYAHQPRIHKQSNNNKKTHTEKRSHLSRCAQFSVKSPGYTK